MPCRNPKQGPLRQQRRRVVSVDVVVMPIELVDPISRLMINSVLCTSSSTQMAVLEAMNGPQKHALAMISEFKNRRDVIVKGLNKIPGIRCTMPKGAFYAFPNIQGTGMTSRQFADELLQEYGVAALAGQSFGAYGEGCIRFSFANSTENLQRALERIAEFVSKNR